MPGRSVTEPDGVTRITSRERPAEIVRGSFSLRRSFDASPREVYSAFADPDRRTAWFRIPGTSEHRLDFRVGGGETVEATTSVTGRTERIEYRSRFIDIAPDERIVYQCESRIDDRLHAISLVSVELTRKTVGTGLLYTDQYALYVYVDGADRATTIAHHEGSLPLVLNGLAGALRRHRI